jgi:hypothetical protein
MLGDEVKKKVENKKKIIKFFKDQSEKVISFQYTFRKSKLF